MKENLIKCTVRTKKGLLLSAIYHSKQTKNLVSVRKIQK